MASVAARVCPLTALLCNARAGLKKGPKWRRTCDTRRDLYFTPSRFCVNLCSLLHKLPRLLIHSHLQSIRIRHTMGLRVFADILGDLHRTEMWAAHGAEVG